MAHVATKRMSIAAYRTSDLMTGGKFCGRITEPIEPTFSVSKYEVKIMSFGNSWKYFSLIFSSAILP